MIRFSDIPAGTLLGKNLRRCLRVVPSHWVIPVIQGPMRGMRWVVGAQNHGMWLGSYEAEKQRAIAAILRPGDTFVDIGANTGFFTLLGARRVGPTGTVVAVEPLQRNTDYLNRHIALNRLANVVVVRKAVSDFDGRSSFSEEGWSTGRLSPGAKSTVEVTTLDSLVHELGVKPDVVKVDVEGAEIDLLRGARRLLEEVRPILFMAVHSVSLFEDLRKLLPAIRYEVTPLDGTESVAQQYWEEVMLNPRRTERVTS